MCKRALANVQNFVGLYIVHVLFGLKFMYSDEHNIGSVIIVGNAVGIHFRLGVV